MPVAIAPDRALTPLPQVDRPRPPEPPIVDVEWMPAPPTRSVLAPGEPPPPAAITYTLPAPSLPVPQEPSLYNPPVQSGPTGPVQIAAAPGAVVNVTVNIIGPGAARAADVGALHPLISEGYVVAYRSCHAREIDAALADTADANIRCPAGMWRCGCAGEKSEHCFIGIAISRCPWLAEDVLQFCEAAIRVVNQYVTIPSLNSGRKCLDPAKLPRTGQFAL